MGVSGMLETKKEPCAHPEGAAHSVPMAEFKDPPITLLHAVLLWVELILSISMSWSPSVSHLAYICTLILPSMPIGLLPAKLK